MLDIWVSFQVSWSEKSGAIKSKSSNIGFWSSSIFLNYLLIKIKSFKKVLGQLKNQFVYVRVSMRLLDILDEGNNSQLFTKEALEDTRKRNKEVWLFLIK